MNIVVIGTGNPYRRDDGVGLVVAQQLRARDELDGVKVIEREGEATELMEAWRGADVAIVIDAVLDSGDAGRIYRFDAVHETLPAELFRYSTHAVGVGEAVELSRALGELPGSVLVYGIEGLDFEAGDGLGADVQAAVQPVVELILVDVRAATKGAARCMNSP